MKILFIASEVAPFAKTGGLADVTGSLPVALKRLGHDVRIILPMYKTVGEGTFPIHKGRKSVEVHQGETLHKGFLRQTTYADMPVYLLENRQFFQRDYLYGAPEGDYSDNHQRFAFFCRGVLNLLKRMDFRPDLLHCHDWQTALVPVLLRSDEYRQDPFFMNTATLFTIHNLAYQGLFPKTSLAEMGLDWSYFTIDRLEFYNQVNLMKGGILAADLVTTVSPTYCKEILSADQGCGLEGVLAERRDDLYGVLNGLDTDEWDPATDRQILKTYTSATLAGKAVNKKGLQKRLGLDVAPDIPLIGMVTRLASQKGIDLLADVLPRLVGENVQFVLLGTGDETYHRLLEDFTAHGFGNISLNIGYDSVCARQIYAGSDIFLMPSHYEPCGLGQLIALRYGAVPVVRKTGGLADTVFDGRDGAREPNGFTFDDFTADALWEAVQRALQAYRVRDAWKKLVRRGMNRDYSWQQPAGDYERLYRAALTKKRI